MLLPGFLVICLLAFSVRAAPPEESPDAIICRGLSAVGFSYEWGGECWCSNGCEPDLVNCEPGVCTPNPGSTGCPECTHNGRYGADCSGFVSKAWQVPNPYSTEACDVSRYRATDFTTNHAYWNVVPMGSLLPADAAANSSHVVLIVGERNAHGNLEVVEAKGCVYGIVRQHRTFASTYSGARRISLTSCECDDGETEVRDCGDCGTQTRTCVNCMWPAFGPCQGTDTPGESCTVEGGIGECARGIRRCVAGWLSCIPNAPATEVCDGLDNDCDGLVDNGSSLTLGEGYPCTNECGEGVSQCIEGAVRCVTPGTVWPDAACNPDNGHRVTETGCSCATIGTSRPLPFALLLLLSGLVFWFRRRHRTGQVH